MPRELKVKLADLVMASIPRRRPEAAALRRCKIISHRGEHDNVSVMENTLPAFARARAAGVWGIECDIQWTADLCPVICHDPDTRRVFGEDLQIDQLSFAELRAAIPEIPSLEEVLAEYAGDLHLMLELKSMSFSQADEQKRILRDLLSALTPGEHFHVLALDLSLFELVDFLPRHSWVAVAEENIAAMSKAVLDQGLGALTGHFLLLNNDIRQRHERTGQRLGTGFIHSRNCLFRELNRGIEWLFSNDAVKLQRILAESLA